MLTPGLGGGGMAILSGSEIMSGEASNALEGSSRDIDLKQQNIFSGQKSHDFQFLGHTEI